METINIKKLDWEVVQPQTLNLFDDFIWTFWSERSFKRNGRRRGQFAGHVFSLLIAVFSIWIYLNLPLSMLGFVFMVGLNTSTLLFALLHCNDTVCGGPLLVLIGVAGLASDLHFGVTVFSYPVEHYLFLFYLAGGTLAILRRRWNQIIWCLLDNIVFRYYVRNKLDLTVPPTPICDYKAAYTLLTEQTIQLLKKQKGNSKQCQTIKTHLENHTEEGLEKALVIIKKELEDNKPPLKKKKTNKEVKHD